jgi:hypothetical protein
LVRFQKETTEVYVDITSSELAHPLWGTGCRYKSYPATTSLENILPDIADYLDWKIVCSTCHRDKEDVNGTFCSNSFHLQAGENLLKMFDEPETN